MPGSEAAASPDGRATHHRLNVLVTSPDSTLARLVTWNLERWGFHPYEDTPGSSADHQLLDAAPLDLIIADLDVGETACWDDAYQLRERHPGTALLLLSHDWPQRDPIAALQPCGYVRKPFSVGDLLATIRQLAPST